MFQKPDTEKNPGKDIQGYSLLNLQAYPHHIDPQAHNKPFVSPFPLGVLGE
jgi:hypothetical protein